MLADKPPFEPIAKCELKFLTLKTVFLVALASGRRRSELHAMCFDSHHFRQNQDQSMVTLYPDFVAKNLALDAVAEPIKLSAFTSVGGGGRMLTGNDALSGGCFNTVRLLPHQSAGKDVRSCLFLTNLQNPMKSNALRFPRGFASSYAWPMSRKVLIPALWSYIRYRHTRSEPCRPQRVCSVA